MSSDPSQNVYLLYLLVKLREYGIFDEQFTSSLLGMTENFYNEQLREKVNQDISNFLDFIKRNATQMSPDSQNLLLSSQHKLNKPTRIYVDGCFDLMHSGHFNAIRQVRPPHLLLNVLICFV